MSQPAQDCLSTIIGLSRTNCECFDDNKPADAAVSDSGIYLDEIDGLPLRLSESASDCEEGSLWDILEKSRNNAIPIFKTDLMASLNQKYKQRRNPFKGVIGGSKFKNSISVPGTHGGVRIYCANIISGVMTIRRIGLAFELADTFDIELYNNVDDQPIQTFTVTTQANKFVWYDLPIPVEIEMSDDTGENPEYYLIYSVTSNKPKDVRAGCGCGGGSYKYYWNRENPMFRTYERERWSEYIMLTGTQGNDISDRENWSTREQLNGIILDAEFSCKNLELICKQSFNYESNAEAFVMAYAIRFRAAASIIDKILTSGNIDRYTMMEREPLMGKKNTFLKEYKERIAYLTDNINWKANDCLACKDFDDVVKVGIFS
jgi:hypothetical protein